MSQLIYHPLPAVSRTSPFDECAIKVAQSGAIRIVSPYIGVGYLERLIALSPEWRLISDVEAWLSSLSFRARPRAWAFIRANLQRIHHCPDIHAKVVLSPKLAMMGSANLTNAGILGRTEMGILLDDPAMIRELLAWFSELWQQTASPTTNEASALIQWLDEEAAITQVRRQKAALSSTSQKVRARLAQLPNEPRPSAAEAPLSLVTVAQALITEEKKHYDSLDNALSAMFNALADGGFSLGDAVRYVRSGFPGALVREVYFGTLRYTANHVRSVFAEETINRLIVTDGRFLQSTKDTLPDALEKYDRFLTRLITHHFDLDVPLEAPSEAQLEEETGFTGREQVLLFSELIDCGLLVLQDLPGSLPMYQLDPAFNGWDGRFKLFSNAAHAWVALTRRIRPSQLRSQQTVEPPELSAHDYERLPNLYGRQDDFDAFDAVEERRLDRLLHMDAIRQARVERALYDLILAELVRCVFGGQQLVVDASLATAGHFSDLLGVPKNIVQSILKGENRVGPRLFSRIKFTPKISSAIVTLNPDASWESLASFPKTRQACEKLLGVVSDHQRGELA